MTKMKSASALFRGSTSKFSFKSNPAAKIDAISLKDAAGH